MEQVYRGVNFWDGAAHALFPNFSDAGSPFVSSCAVWGSAVLEQPACGPIHASLGASEANKIKAQPLGGSQPREPH